MVWIRTLCTDFSGKKFFLSRMNVNDLNDEALNVSDVEFLHT